MAQVVHSSREGLAQQVSSLLQHSLLSLHIGSDRLSTVFLQFCNDNLNLARKKGRIKLVNQTISVWCVGRSLCSVTLPQVSSKHKKLLSCYQGCAQSQWCVLVLLYWLEEPTAIPCFSKVELTLFVGHWEWCGIYQLNSKKRLKLLNLQACHRKGA